MKNNTSPVLGFVISSIGALALGFLAASSHAADEVSFKYRVPQPGENREVAWRSAADIKIKIKVDGNTMNSVSTKNEETRTMTETVIESNNEAVTKQKVVFGDMKTSVSNSQAGEKNETLPVSGKTYVLEVKNGELLATDGTGGKVDGIELDILKKQYRSLGKPDRIGRFFSDKKLKIGESVELTKEVLSEMEDSRGGAKVESMAFSLKGTRKEGNMVCAVFDTVMKMSSPTGMFGMLGTELKGETLIDTATCWPVSMNLQGPVKISGTGLQGQQKIEIEGEGKAEMSSTVKFGK